MTEEVRNKPVRSTELDRWVKLSTGYGDWYLPVGGISELLSDGPSTYVRGMYGPREVVKETPEQVIDAINKAADAHFEAMRVEKERVYNNIKSRLESVLDEHPFDEEKETEKIMRMNDFLGKDVN